MRFLPVDVVFQEVPSEVSIVFHITECPNGCTGCHSHEVNRPGVGEELTETRFRSILEQYRFLATCVLFWGGEWEPEKLMSFLRIAGDYGYKTCLYSGQEKIMGRLYEHLDYVKLGPYLEEFGGLENPNTNQQFINVETGECLNHLFQVNYQNIKEDVYAHTFKTTN